MQLLEHVDFVEGVRTCQPRDVPNTPCPGARGGVRNPIRVVWKPIGYGVFALSRQGRTSLFPYVEFTNGVSDRARYEPVEKWLAQLEQQATVQNAPVQPGVEPVAVVEPAPQPVEPKPEPATGEPVLPQPQSPTLPAYTEFELAVEALHTARARVETICTTLATADDLEGVLEQDLAGALASRKKALTLVGSCVIRLLAAGYKVVGPTPVLRAESPAVAPIEPQVVPAEPAAELSVVPVVVDLPAIPEPVAPPRRKAVESPPAVWTSPPPRDRTPKENLKYIVESLDKSGVLSNPISSVARFNALAGLLLDVTTDIDQWAAFDINIQRALVGLVAAAARHLQDETFVDSAGVLPLNQVFSRLTAFSGTYRPGFVRGLTRAHSPNGESWVADLKFWYSELSMGKPAPIASAYPPAPFHPRFPSPQSTPRTVFALYGEVVDDRNTKIRVQESSAVGRPHVYLFSEYDPVSYPAGKGAPHLSVEQAEKLIHALQRFVDHAKSLENWRNDEDYIEKWG